MKARDNPLRTSRVLRIRYRPRGWEWEDLMAWLEALGFRAAIVGPHGSGKTTLMEDLEPRLRGRGFVLHHLRLNEANRRIAPGRLRDLAGRVGSGDCLLLDGAEQLGSWGWWRFRRRFRHAGGLLITAHRPGLLPTLVRCETSPALLAGILGELVSWPEGEVRAASEELHARHGGNIRDALRELYDRERGQT